MTAPPVDDEVSSVDELVARLEQARHGAFYNQVAVANVADLLALKNSLEQLRRTVAELLEEVGRERAATAAVQARLDYYTAHDRRLFRLGKEHEAAQKRKGATEA